MALTKNKGRAPYTRPHLGDPLLTIRRVDRELDELSWEMAEQPDRRRDILAAIDRWLDKRIELIEVDRLRERLT